MNRLRIFGLTGRTVVVSSLAALLAMWATVMTGLAFDRLRESQDRLTKVELERLMTSVRLIQATESLGNFGLLLAQTDNHEDRRRSLVELQDREKWITRLIGDLASTDDDRDLIARVTGARDRWSDNIRSLNDAVRDRIDAAASGNGPAAPGLAGLTADIKRLSTANRELAAQFSALIGYVAASIRRQLQDQNAQLVRDIARHQRHLFILTALLAMSTIAAGLYFQYRVVDRVLKLQRAVDQDEVDPAALAVGGNDEITRLAHTVDRYVKRIQAQEARMKAVNAELAFLAEHDPLTHLANRRHFDVAARQLLRYSPVSLCLAIADIDHFKRVNDHHGHAVGDLALIQVARQLQAGLRENDVLARFGGEEFCVVAPVSSIRAAREVFDRIRERIAAEPLALKAGGQLRLTLSFGLALIDGLPLARDPDPAQAQTLLDTVMHAADDALYQAKETGRNRVCVSTVSFNATEYLSKALENQSA